MHTETVGSVFRRHPELEPTGKLSLLGKACCSAERMDAYARRRNPDAPEVAEMYLRQGERYGVRGDVAYCQMVYETRGWTLEVSGPSWSPLTLEQWAEEASIEVHMQMLYTFATKLALPDDANATGRQVGWIERARWRGCAPCWEDLNGKWSTPGHSRYGQDIVAMWRSMVEWKGKGEVEMNHSERPDPLRTTHRVRERIAGRGEGGAFTNEQMKWLQEQQLLPIPLPHPDQKVTWAELVTLLHRWENQSSTATIEGNKVSS